MLVVAFNIQTAINDAYAFNFVGKPEKDQFCEADGDWEVTGAGYTAVLKCKNAAGRRRRTCQVGYNCWSSQLFQIKIRSKCTMKTQCRPTDESTHCFSSAAGTWGSEVSACVNNQVDSVLQIANVRQSLQSQTDDKMRSSFF